MKIELVAPVDFYGRLVNTLVQNISNLKCNVYFEKDERSCNAKSIIGLLSLHIIKDEKFSIKCYGQDEEKAIEIIKKTIEEYAY